MESTLTAASKPGELAGRPLDEWNAAYEQVESYFKALRVENKLLRGQLVSQVLDRAMRRAPAEPNAATIELALEEMDAVITEWYAEVLDEPVEKSKALLSTRGRLALMLVDMPGRWQDQFLKLRPMAGGVCQRDARRLSSRAPGFPVLRDDAASAGTWRDHHPHRTSATCRTLEWSSSGSALRCSW
jgi:hypothetical protein